MAVIDRHLDRQSLGLNFIFNLLKDVSLGEAKQDDKESDLQG